jgi:uncharacterized RDD family membrane protein YckC
VPDREPALLRDDAGRATSGSVETGDSDADGAAERRAGRALHASGVLPVASAMASAVRRDGERSDGGGRGAASARPGTQNVLVAGFWRRLGAALIDLGIVGPVALILTALASLVAGVELPPSRMRGLDFWLDLALSGDPALSMAMGLFVAIGLIYLLVFQITTARTIGMRVLGLRIIDVYGDPPSSARCAARTAGYLAGAATLLLGFLWIGFDSEKRGLHDWLAGTYVIRG